jgi:ribosomal protein S12 methylthiotransferase
MGNEADDDPRAVPDVLAVTGAHQYEAVVEAVHEPRPLRWGPIST